MRSSIIVSVLCLIITVAAASAESAVRSTAVSKEPATTPVPEKKEKTALERWKQTDKELQKTMNSLVKAMLPQILQASETMNLTGACSRSLMKFLTGLKQMKLWAFRMVDSSGKLPNGILSGSINSFGDYDVCIDTVIPGNIKAAYCTLFVQPPLPPRVPFTSYDDPIPEFVNYSSPDKAIHDFMRKGMNYHHVKFRSSICMPSTCNKDEVQAIASKVIEMSGLGFDIIVPNCEVKVEQIVLDKTETGIAVLLATIVFIAAVATFTDVVLKLRSEEQNYQRNLNVPVKCLLAFSIYTNFKKLMKVEDNPDTIKIIHGFKAITILWVILAHNYFYQNFQAMSHLLEVREKGKEIFFQLISNGVMSVETFFFISAVLVSYGVTNLKGKLNVFLYIFRRFWRLTPPYMLVIATGILLPHISSGPVWKETLVDRIVEKCRRNWWTNLLYFSNFVPTADMCLDWSWYIPVDTQMYLLSLIVLIPLQRNPRIAMTINAGLCLGGIIISAAFVVYYKLNPVAIYVFMHPDDVNYFIDRGYYRTYLHICSYSVGLTVGHILAKKKKIRIPLPLNLLGWIISFALGFSVTIGVYSWHQGNVPSMLISVLYLSLKNLAFSLGLAYVTIACMTGHGGVATTILSWNGFVPLSRLTYMTYLVHPFVHFTYYGTIRNPIAALHPILVHQYCGTVVLSFLIACVLSLLYEAPFMALEKVFLSPRRPKEDRGMNKNENIEAAFQPTIVSNGHSLKNDRDVHAINFKKIGQEVQ